MFIGRRIDIENHDLSHRHKNIYYYIGPSIVIHNNSKHNAYSRIIVTTAS